ncbi:MAG TPA: hypothetical protein VK601_27915, partial [Kofleriaceae bacterium]|nr:hypothetical protein [Kofleriaceae bacterium]
MSGGFEALDLPARAAALGLTVREFTALAESDRRIVEYPACSTDGSVARLRRWLDAGRPRADPERVAFTGADSVRVLVQDVLRSLPDPVRWHGVEYTLWVEVGRSAGAWQSSAPTPRAPPCDVAHFIALGGLASDEYLRGVSGHELGHAWHRPVYTIQLAHVPMSDHERAARHLVVAKHRGADLDQHVRELVAEERLADRTAA